MMNNLAVVITAAGTSQRINQTAVNPIKKEYMPLADGTVLSSSVTAFLSLHLFSTIVITIPPYPSSQKEAEKALLSCQHMLQNEKITLLFVNGSTTRQKSVCNALEALHAHAQKNIMTIDAVLIHDGARPWISQHIIQSVIDGVKKHGAAAPVIPAVDTQKEINENGKIIRHLNRTNIVSIQTPQGFLFSPLLAAHQNAVADGNTYTDDTEIWGHYEGEVYVCAGEIANKKITYKEDLPQ